MRRARSSILAAVLALGGLAAGCKKSPDEALVVFNVTVNTSVQGFTSVHFSVSDPAGVPPRHHDRAEAAFRFGYYMPGVNGDVTILGQAVDASECVVGQGTLTVQNVKAGQTVTVDPNTPLLITSSPRSCPTDGGTDGGMVGGHGGQGTGGAGGRAGAGGTGGSGGVGGRGVGGASGGQAGGPATKAALGLPCNAGSDCASTFCVDGVCCQSSCSGACEACGETSQAGQCVAITGTPRPSHTACAGAGTPCAGTCDGASRMTCTYPGSSQACRAASCTGSTATLAAVCDGNGACPSAQTVDCTPNVCAGTICAGGCTDSSTCASTTYCGAGKCVAKKGNGQVCTAAGECTSGYCADGVCCNGACTTACTSCNLTGLAGTCSPVKSAIDDTCSGTQSCDATGSCKKASGQTCTAAADCASGACVDGTCCGAASCGACQACTGGGGTCVAVTSADDPDSCTSTKSCDATGACKLKPGQACTAASQCVSGFCADGVCCNAACTGGCEACAESSSPGSCVAVSGAPRSGHTACAGSGTCGGACDGTTRTACSYPGASTSCRSASCTSGTATLAAGCNGSGACPAAQTVTCAPNSCASTACAGGCSSTQACANSSYYCSGGSCVTKKTNGTACGGAGECTSGACVDGMCCGSASCGSCQSCTGAGGTCVAVTSGDDSDSCSGGSTCDGSGACKLKQGQTCTTGSQCVTTFCVDGVCCGSACNGACQYCKGATPGTCAFVSGSPQGSHGPCAGSGSCVGSCNGTQAACTMPGSETVCRSTSCSSGTQTNQAVCNGSGTCPTSSTTGCGAYVCNGTSSCNTKCTSASQCTSGNVCSAGMCGGCPGGQSICAGACYTTSSDPNHCGSGCAVCSGATPSCVNSSCTCRQKSPSNLFANPGLAGSITSWDPQGSMASYGSMQDAEGCSASGSIALLNSGDTVYQCVTVGLTPGLPYKFGYLYKNAAGSGTAYCGINFYSGFNCGGDGLTQFAIGATSDGSSWVPATYADTVPAGAVSFSIVCDAFLGTGYYDEFYFNQSSGTATF